MVYKRRKQKKNRKTKKILIRVNDSEKKEALAMAKELNLNTSAFLRGLLKQYKDNNKDKLNSTIIAKHNKILSSLKEVLK